MKISRKDLHPIERLWIDVGLTNQLNPIRDAVGLKDLAFASYKNYRSQGSSVPTSLLRSGLKVLAREAYITFLLTPIRFFTEEGSEEGEVRKFPGFSVSSNFLYSP